MDKSKLKKLLLVNCSAVIWAILGVSSVAQITPDTTLPSPSIVNSQANQTLITGGTTIGNHLFHSFSEFSVPTGTSTRFNNALGIQNIFTRITGSNASTIDGLIQANGTANLYLLNPNGILFGANAQLDIGGSFVASTSDRLTFDTGEFSAVNPQAPPLLTISVKPGLQTARVGSAIVAQGNLSVPQDLTLHADQLQLNGQLQAGRNLTLRSANPMLSNGSRFNSGGNVRIERSDDSLGTLISFQTPVVRALGDVELEAYQGGSLQILAGGSVKIPGFVRIENPPASTPIVSSVPLSDGTTLAIDSQAESTLDVRAGVKLGETTSSRADIQIGTIAFAEGSGKRIGNVLLTNQFEPNLLLAGDIEIGHTDAVAVNTNGLQMTIDSRGRFDVGRVLLGFSVFGTGGDTKVLAQNDVLIPYMRTVGEFGNGGNVTIASGRDINLLGGIDTSAVRMGNSGKIQLAAAGNITSNTLLSVGRADGDSADISLSAGGTINLIGTISTLTDTGKAGNIQLTAKGNITTGVLDSGSVSGSAGQVQLTSLEGGIDTTQGVISASTSIPAGNGNAVTLNAAGDIKANLIRSAGGFTGKSGDITLTSLNGSIFVQDGNLFSATLGTGEAGKITLKAAQNVSIVASDLSSSVIFGFGGKAQDITIDAGNSILLDRTALASSSGIEDLAVSNSFGLRDLANFSEIVAYWGIGDAGNISLKAGQDISIRDSALYSTVVYTSEGNAGNIDIAAKQVTLERIRGGFRYPGVYAFSRGQGDAGDVTIGADSLTILGTSIETGQSFAAIGQSGNIKLNVRDNMLLDGHVWMTMITTQIKPSGQSVQSIGSKGNIDINAGSLTLRNGVEIGTGVGDTSPAYVGDIGDATGNAGNIDLKVSRDLSISESAISSRVFSNGTGNAGKINIQAGSIRADRAVITSSTAGRGNANTIRLSADSMNLNNTDISSAVQPGGRGEGREIIVNARSLFLNNGTQINTVASGAGSAGNVQVVADDMNIGGLNFTRTPTNFLYAWQPIPGQDFGERPFANAFPSSTAPDFLDGVTSGIFSSTNTQSQGGNITVNARSLTLSDNAAIDARTTASGAGGTISINADQIDLQSGGQISAVTTGQGQGGRISLTANQVQISGTDPTYLDRLRQFQGQTDIYGKARVANQGAESGVFASTEPLSSGSGGTIAIASRNVAISDKGVISVDSKGSGNGGEIQVNAGNLTLDRGNILAKTESGEGGNIALTVQNLLKLRRNSQISATANQSGNGGNIDITADGFILAVPNENSDITANANQGRGGNIRIKTQSIFGITPTSLPTEFSSDITASSEIGLDGTVKLTTLQAEPNQRVQKLPQLVDTSDQIAQTCSPQMRSNQFVITGRGGLPPNPTEALNVPQVWSATDARAEGGSAQDSTIAEATHWVKSSDGTVALVAGAPVQSNLPNCLGVQP
jgi:filamentous hemagglutinin family protein